MQGLETLSPGIIRLAKSHSEQLAEQYGTKLVEEYRAGATHKELARRYSSDWPISENVAGSAIAKALELLLDEDERTRIQAERNRVNGRNISRFWTREKLIARTEGCNQRSYRGTKILTEYGEMEELDYYSLLVRTQLEANANSGRRKKVNWREVAKKTNALFGNNRTPAQLHSHYGNIVLGN
ncbi:MAG: hypothetical protein AABW80_02540 [Nanoarchaeota archaeon]